MEGSLVAYKVFTNGSVLPASDVNTYLMNQSVMVFSNSTTRAAALTAPVEGMLTWLEDSNKYFNYNGTAWVPLGGGILQVVSVPKLDTFTSSSATFTNVTGMAATITPSSTSSKVLVLAQVSYSLGAINTGNGAFKITRGGTDIYRGNAATTRTQAVFGGYNAAAQSNNLIASSIHFLDSPASVSALTYQLEAKIMQSGSINVNITVDDAGDPARVVRGASSITLMEVAG
jgi:hypothetical protein